MAREDMVKLAATRNLQVHPDDVVIVSYGRNRIGWVIISGLSNSTIPKLPDPLSRTTPTGTQPIGIVCVAPEGNFQSRSTVVYTLVRAGSRAGSTEIQAISPNGEVKARFSSAGVLSNQGEAGAKLNWVKFLGEVLIILGTMLKNS
jgi:hypothetical protein